MRTRKLFLALLLLLIACYTHAQYVQPMTYKDYSFPWQTNIGSTKLKTTYPSAYLELGDSTFSKKGFLPPRGWKDSVKVPIKGMIIHDIPTNKPYWHDGSKWQLFGTVGVDSLYHSTNDTIYWQKNGTTYNLGKYITNNTADLLYASLTGYNKTNWDSAYAWGNHASAGYLTNITGKVQAGTNVTLSGAGTTASPYVINASGGVSSVDTTSLSNRINALDKQSARVYYLTKNGAVSDANLAMGSTGLGTDNTAIVQAILDKASASNPIWVIVDGKFRVNQLKIKGNTRITGLNKSCGFIQPYNWSGFMVINYNRSKNSYIDSSITLENLTLNGAGFVNGAFNKPLQTAENMYNVVIQFAGVYGLTVKDVNMVNSRAYMSWVTNCKNILYENIDVRQNPAAPAGLLDGCDFVGNIYNLTLRNLSGYTKDDIFALASSFGWQSDDPNGVSVDAGNTQSSYYQYASLGPVQDVLVDGVVFDNCYNGFRIMSVDETEKLDRITIRNLRGSIVGGLIGIIDNYTIGSGGNQAAVWHRSSGLLGNVGKILIEDVDIVKTSPFPCYYIGFNLDEIVIRNMTRDDLSDGKPTVVFGTPARVKRAHIDNLKTRSSSSSVVNMIETESGAVISYLSLANIQHDRSLASFNASAVLKVVTGSAIGNLRINGLEQYNCSPAINFGSAYLGNVLAANIVIDPAANFLQAGGSVPQLTLSNFSGGTTHTGTVSVTTGDAFMTDLLAVPFTKVWEAEFNGTAGTSLASYTPDLGTLTITEGSATLNGSGALSVPASTLRFTTSVTPANVRISATIGAMGSGGNAILLARTTGSTSYVFASVADAGTSGQIAIVQSIGGVQTTLKTLDIADPSTLANQNMVFTVNGTGCTFSYGSNQISAETSLTSAGEVRFVSLNSTLTLNNFKVETYQ